MPPVASSSKPQRRRLRVACLAGATAFALAGGPFVLAAGASDPVLVRLKAASFDPLLDGEPDLSLEPLPEGRVLRPGAAGAGRVRLVQFHGPIGAREQSALALLGVEVLGFVPDSTLVVRLPVGEGEHLLRAAPGVRWEGSFRRGYNLSPDLRRALTDGAGPPSLVLDVFLFPDEDPRPIAAGLAAQGPAASVRFVRERRPVRVTVEVAGHALAAVVAALAGDPAVMFVEERRPLVAHNDNAVWIGQSGDRTNGPGEATAADPKPYAQSATVWSRGLTGAGEIVAVADTGLETGLCFFDDPLRPAVAQTVAPPATLTLDPDHRKILAWNAPHASSLATDDSFRHGTHTAGSAVGDDLAHPAQGGSAGHDSGDGMAPAARLVFEDVSGPVNSACSTSITVDSMDDLLVQEYAAGARISSNSWGGSAGGGHDGTTVELDQSGFTLEDMLVLFSAGNGGAGGVSNFAACKNCVAVGATENYDGTHDDVFGILDPENMTAFSSRGPTPDGRIKPDVVAPGHFVHSARFPVQYAQNAGDPICDPSDPGVCFPGFGGCYVTDDGATCHSDRLLGTSMSTPVVAGLAALVRQYFTEGFWPPGAPSPTDARQPTAALVKAVLINGARNLTGRLYERRGAPVDFGPLLDAPSNVQGWGRVTLDDALEFTGDARRLHVEEIPNAEGLATGERLTSTLSVSSAAEPLKATLVWTDAPGLPLSAGVLVDDLDLELTTSDGKAYRGNQWTTDNVNVVGDKASAPNATGRDTVNNVEGVRVPAPSTGLVRVQVTGRNVPGTMSLARQGYALVVTGAVGPCTAVPPPSGLRVTDYGASHVTLGWDAVPGAFGYEVRRNRSGCRDPFPADRTFAIAPGATSFTDSTVDSGIVHHYSIRALTSAAGCVTADGACVSALTVEGDPPPPVPDGSVGTPLRVGKGTQPNRLVLTWDATTCPAEGHHLLHGDLDTVAAPGVGGAACGLGTSGSFEWIGVPPGDLWLLIVAESAAGIEGSWGARSDDTPRGGGVVSGHCGMLVRDDSETCP
jgi:hypothetical protein